MIKELISRRVLLDNINNWLDQSEYYDGKRPKNIPISILKEIIKDCPNAGDDEAYLIAQSKRLQDSYFRGQRDLVNKIKSVISEGGG